MNKDRIGQSAAKLNWRLNDYKVEPSGSKCGNFILILENIKYDIVIKEDEIYLRFHCGSMFEPQALKKGIINKEQLERYFYMLNFTYNLSNRLIELINETEI